MNNAFCPSFLRLPQSLAATVREPCPALPEWTYASAHAYCKDLATSHYENFHVGTWLLPASVREHAYNVYAYCRWSDDLADETHDTALSLELLSWWRGRVEAMYAGKPDHPVFIALAETVKKFSIPKDPFIRLIEAFELDQRKNRYANFDELVDYCRKSADPVGHLVLYLLGYSDERRQKLSDKTCTALQLANHWQDIARDLVQNRIYLPQDSMARFGVTEDDLRQKTANAAVRKLLEFEVARARAMFIEGMPLRHLVKGRARLDIELFSRGGLAILDAIVAQDYDVLKSRPVVGSFAKMKLMAGVLCGAMFGKSAEAAS